MRLLISGGASGGHVTAALAVASAFRDTHRGGEVLIVGRTGGIEEELVPAVGLPLETIVVRGWDRDAAWKNVRLPTIWPWALGHGLHVLDRFQPDVVLGVGAHAMVPCVAAAYLQGVPYVLQVSEPGGLANRMLRRGAAAACVSFAADVEAFVTRRTVVTGYPIRHGFRRRTPSIPPRRLLVMGGSLGARRINEAVWEVLDGLLGRFDRVVHLTGVQGAGRGAALARPGYVPISTTVDVAGLMAEADLVVSRAGVGTCAEVLAVGLPAILVPGRFGGGHQEHNAAMLEAAGAAVRVPDAELSGERLLRCLDGLTGDRLRRIAGAAAAMAMPGAAEAIVEVLDRVDEEARGRRSGRLGIGREGTGKSVGQAQALEVGTHLGEQVGAEVVSQV